MDAATRKGVPRLAAHQHVALIQRPLLPSQIVRYKPHWPRIQQPSGINGEARQIEPSQSGAAPSQLSYSASAIDTAMSCDPSELHSQRRGALQSTNELALIPRARLAPDIFRRPMSARETDVLSLDLQTQKNAERESPQGKTLPRSVTRVSLGREKKLVQTSHPACPKSTSFFEEYSILQPRKS
jgi:hypothetical protein